MIEVQIPLVLTATQLQEVVETALEGGIDYWCESACWKRGTGRAPDEFGPDDELVLTIQDGDEIQEEPGVIETPQGWQTTLTRKHFLEGLQKFGQQGRLHFTKYGEEIDLDVDASDADCIVQLGCFGKVIFG